MNYITDEEHRYPIPVLFHSFLLSFLYLSLSRPLPLPFRTLPPTPPSLPPTPFSLPSLPGSRSGKTDAEITAIVLANFDLRPGAIIRDLNLRRYVRSYSVV
jgi:hypothetical protein